MPKIQNPHDLRNLREQLQMKFRFSHDKHHELDKVRIRVAMATCGIASGAAEVMNFFTTALEQRGIDAIITQTGCMGYCYAEPTVEVTLPGRNPLVFGHVDVRKADAIIEKYIKHQELVDGIIPVNYQIVD